jgi:uncharacterized protein (DUF1697 family)
MPQYVAFLRAINVGGRVVKMDRLRSIFEQLGHAAVTTFIASGNVLFQSKSRSAKKLEQDIEASLQKELGYTVATFIRTAAELTEVAALAPFKTWNDENVVSRYIAFVAAPPAAGMAKKLKSLCEADDQFHCANREIYWLGQTKVSDSKFNGALLEKTLGAPATMRNVNTVRKIAALLSS